MTFLRAFLLLVFVFPVTSFAEVYINEIMYNLPSTDSGREWIEIYNSGPDPVTIVTGSANAAWRFSDGSQHTLTSISGGTILNPDSYAIIADNATTFLSEWPAFSGMLFDSSFSLNNTGATLAIYSTKDGTALDQVTYVSSQGGSDDGNSLQKSSSSWIAALPTPGFVNSSTSATSPVTEVGTTTATTTPSASTSATQEWGGGVNTYSAHSSPAPVSTAAEKVEIEVSAGRNRLTTIETPVMFRAVPTKLQNISESSISYEWSFGDGSVGMGKEVTHSYKFSGDYTVVLNAKSGDKQAVSRTQVRVIVPDLKITFVSGGVEVWNKSSGEINLEGWKLVSKEKTFIFPKDTLIMSQTKIIFPYEITGIKEADVDLTNGLSKISFTSVTVPLATTTIKVASTSSANLSEIQAKINEVKATLAKISPKPAITKKVQLKALEVKNSIISNDVVTLATSTMSQTAVVFQATGSPSLGNKLLHAPVRSFRFIKHFFFEE